MIHIYEDEPDIAFHHSPFCIRFQFVVGEGIFATAILVLMSEEHLSENNSKILETFDLF